MPNDLSQLGLRYEGDGSFLTTGPYWTVQCDMAFAIGEVIHFQRWEERSAASHNHEFAWLSNAWLSLPESVSDLYPTPEHLRKRALIAAGYYNEQIVDAGSKAAAVRVAAAFRSREEFSITIVRGPLVVIRTAKSQSRRTMDKEEFQTSKTAIMEIIAGILGITVEEVGRAA